MNALRVGLMVPANNTTMDHELPAWMPAGSTCRTLKIPRGKGMLTHADLPAYLGQATTMARDLADDGIDVVVYGCTAAGFLAGPERDAQVAVDLGAVTGKPTVTTASAMAAALKDIGARNIALVTPYLDAVNERLKAFLKDSGIAVQVLSTFGAKTTEELGEITAAQVAERSREVMRANPGVDALFIACTQLPTREVLDGLEREFKKPAWSSIRATAWQASRACAAAPVS